MLTAKSAVAGTTEKRDVVAPFGAVGVAVQTQAGQVVDARVGVAGDRQPVLAERQSRPAQAADFKRGYVRAGDVVWREDCRPRRRRCRSLGFRPGGAHRRPPRRHRSG